MLLFHGTTQSRAESILANGFRTFDLAVELDNLSRRHSLPTAQILADLERHSRFSAFRKNDTRVFFTTGRAHAASYARRAPEVEWEGLWAIYRIRHPALGSDWNMSDEGHYWVLRQQEADLPVVLAFDADPAVATVDTDLFKPDDPNNGFEVALEPGELGSCTPAVEVLDRAVDGSLLRFITGLAPAELSAQVEAGLWGTPTVYRREPSWDWQDVRRRLGVERRRQLGITDLAVPRT